MARSLPPLPRRVRPAAGHLPASMATAAGTMPGGTTPRSPLRTPVLSLRSPSTAASPLHHSTPPVGVGTSGDLGQDPVDTKVVRSPASSKKMRMKPVSVPKSITIQVTCGDIVKLMVKEMQDKFHKYFKESYLTNCIPVILDPRFKMDHVEFRLKKYFGADVDKPLKQVKEAIEVLFAEYAAQFQDKADVLAQEGRSGDQLVLADSALSDWDDHVKLKKAKSCNELQRYLEEDFHPRTSDFDILNWWAVNSARYPILGTIARDVLAVPASSVASESAFSICGRVVTDHRSSLAAETVEALMCLEDWIRHACS